MSRVYLWILALDALKRDSLWRQQPATFLQKVCHGFLEGRIVKNPPTFGVLSVTMQWSRERDRPGRSSRHRADWSAEGRRFTKRCSFSLPNVSGQSPKTAGATPALPFQTESLRLICLIVLFPFPRFSQEFPPWFQRVLRRPGRPLCRQSGE